MTSLRVPLSMLSALGCLRPITWTSSFKKFVYSAYSVIVFGLIQSIVLMQVLDLILNVKTQEDLSDNVYITMSVLGCVCKMVTFLLNRKNIILLIKTLQKEPFSPRDDEEVDIKMRFDKIIDMNTIQFMAVVQATMLVVWIGTPIVEGKNRKLAFRAWTPYNYSSVTLYTVTYLYQTVGLTFDTTMHVACDSLFNGLLICIYGQLEILGHRLQNIKNDQKKSAKKCARHHHQLYVYAASVNKQFRTVLCFQLIAATSMVCFSIFQLTQTRLDEKVIEHVMFTVCAMLQIFYYCWYGNEVRRKSLEVPDIIFASNWMYLDKNSKRILLVIMIRSTYPMEFKSAHIMHVNLESFMTVIKTSYSAYNVLKQG